MSSSGHEDRQRNPQYGSGPRPWNNQPHWQANPVRDNHQSFRHQNYRPSVIMESKRQHFYKKYATILNDEQEPVAGTSKTPLKEINSKPSVVKRLVFKTPRKKHYRQKSILNIANKELSMPLPVVMCSKNKETAPPCIDFTVCDLIDDTKDPFQEKNIAEKKSNDVIQKEFEIFREIQRLHEIEEACQQIRQEHFDEIESKQPEKTVNIIINDEYNTATTEIEPNKILDRCDSNQFLQEKEDIIFERNYINTEINIQDKENNKKEIYNAEKIPDINETVQNELYVSKYVDKEIGTGDAEDSIKERHEHLKQIKHDEQIKNKRLRQQTRAKYVDFLSDNEDFVWSSSSWEDSSYKSVSSDAEDGTKKRKKLKQKNKTTTKTTKSKIQVEKNEISEVGGRQKKKQKNKRKETKAKRDAGYEYVTSKGKVIAAKEMKPNPCTPQTCSNICYKLTDERRKMIFTHFWSLSSERRKDWLVSHSKKMAIKRKRTDTGRRANTFTYFINDGEGQIQVCLQFLTCTLDMKQKTVYNIVSNASFGSAKDDMRGKHEPQNKTSTLVTEKVRTYIKELPALPSHYCRKNSTRSYLPTEFRNISNLYRIYKETQVKDGNVYAGEKHFKKIFTTEFNIGFHLPRKDKCLKCIQYENDKNFDAEEKRKHLIDKEESAARFKAHQIIHNKDNSVLCASFDLQKVLNTPHGENMMLYYSRKVAVYIYESGTRNGYCYTWSENNGKRGANEVSSILQKYVNNVDQRGSVKHLLLYCDSCPGQNKNKIVLTCLNEILQSCNNLLSIQINYLLPGHTYMPVDSMHSVIERSLRGIIVWAPSQWSTIFTMARKLPKPYEVEVLGYADFTKWDIVAEKYFKGNLTGKISKLRTVTFKKSVANMAFVKYSMNPDAQTEQIEIVKKRNIQLKPCYKAMLPICKQKYTDLSKLCSNKVIPTVYHTEYLSMNNSPNAQDCLAETDVEDEVSAQE